MLLLPGTLKGQALSTLPKCLVLCPKTISISLILTLRLSLPSWGKEPEDSHLRNMTMFLFSFVKEYLKSINSIHTLKYFIFNKYVNYKDKNDSSQDPIPMMNMAFP